MLAFYNVCKQYQKPKTKMLCEDTIVDLLSCVPAKTIGRFRCASKSWRSLLSQPQFIKTHLNRTKQLPREEESVILVSHDSHSLYSVQFKNAHNLYDVNVFAIRLTFDDRRFASPVKMSSCDGLILILDEQELLLLVNPTTREIKELPSSPYALNLLSFGLGYDSVNDDYKVVTISHNQMFVAVYSIRNGTWKSVENSPFDHTHPEFTYEGVIPGVFVNGYIHWMAVSDDSYVIAAFDLGEEKFSQVPLPSFGDSEDSTASTDSDLYIDYGVYWEYIHSLVALGGYLCGYPEGISDTCHQLFVGMMKEYGVKESWTKILFNEDSDAYSRPVCLLGKEQLVLLENEDSPKEKFVIYNIEEKTYKDIVVHGIPDKFGVGGSFTESLVSPHHKL